MLLKLYPPLMNLVQSIIGLILDKNISLMGNQILKFIQSPEMQKGLLENLKSKIFLIYNMIESIPGSGCYLVGYKLAVPIRSLFNISPF